MRIVMHSELELTLSHLHEPGMDISTDEHVHVHFSALQMFATSLALCTGSVLVGYGEQIDAPTDELAVRIRWSVAEKPRRISEIHMEIRWPGLPHSRLGAAQRAAAHCTLHNTLHQATPVHTVVRHD